ncbi:hypothetical protein Plhal304r1_c027g0090051 [Plasmopara halstedii]
MMLSMVKAPVWIFFIFRSLTWHQNHVGTPFPHIGRPLLLHGAPKSSSSSSNNVFLRFTKANRTLAQLHRKACNYLSHQNLLQISTFRSVFGWIPDEITLRESLACSSIKPGRYMTLVVQKLAPRLEVPLHYQNLTIFPLPPEALICALHVWTFDGLDIVYASNTVIKRLLLEHDPHPLPLLQLSIPDVVVTSFLWSLVRFLQRDILPVYSDFLFRLQQNGLAFRYKYRWHTEDTNCVHGCTILETPYHLLWGCPTAQHLWHLFLSPFSRLFGLAFSWPQVLFLYKVTVPAAQQASYGLHTPLRLFNVVRCVILRTLWLNRNKAIFDAPPLQFTGVYRQVLVMVRLYFQLLYKKLTNPQKHDIQDSRSNFQHLVRNGIKTSMSIHFIFLQNKPDVTTMQVPTLLLSARLYH